MAIFHLATVGFQADRAGFGKFQRVFENFAVAFAVGEVVVDGHDQVVPILRFVVFQFFVGAGDEVIAALKLRLAEEDAAVGVDGGAELQLEGEVAGEFFGGPELTEAGAFGGVVRMDGEDFAIGGVPAVAGFGSGHRRRGRLCSASR